MRRRRVDDTYRKGDNWLIDDRSGARIRRSDARMEWDGTVVHKDEFEPRHPQDFVKGRVDRQIPPQPIRSEPVDVLTGPLVTTLGAGAAAGDTSITVVSTVRMEAGDTVKIMLDNHEAFRVAIVTVDSATGLTIFSPLPWAASSGNSVIDETALAVADIG